MRDQTKETEIFQKAVCRLQIKTIDGPTLFNVTRQTLANWIHGKSKVPHSAFITLLDIENKNYYRTRERLADIQEIANRINSGDLQTTGSKDNE